MRESLMLLLLELRLHNFADLTHIEGYILTRLPLLQVDGYSTHARGCGISRMIWETLMIHMMSQRIKLPMATTVLIMPLSLAQLCIEQLILNTVTITTIFIAEPRAPASLVLWTPVVAIVLDFMGCLTTPLYASQGCR